MTVGRPREPSLSELRVQLAEVVVAMAPGVQLRLASDALPACTVSVAVCVTPQNSRTAWESECSSPRGY
jgi:hypothetical protein